MDLQNKTENTYNDFEDFCRIENLKEKKRALSYSAKMQTREEWEREHTPAMCLRGY